MADDIVMLDPKLADRLTRRRDYAVLVAIVAILMLAWSAAHGGVTPDPASKFVVVDDEGRRHVEHSAKDDRFSICFALPKTYWLEFSSCIMREDEMLERGRVAPRPVFKPLQEGLQ